MSTTIHQLINTKKNLAKASVSPITVSFGTAPEKITEASSSTSVVNVTASQISVHSTKNSDSNAENSLGLYSPVKKNNEPSEPVDPNKSVTALDLIKNIQQTHCSSSQPSSPKLKEENQSYTESFSWIKGIFNHSVESLNGFSFYTPGPSMEGISGSMISQYFSQQKSTTDEPAPLTGLVFGVPLQVATLNSLLTRDVPLPAIVIRCVEYLDNYGLNEIGLYRIPGGTSEVMQLKNQFDCGSDLDLSIDPPDPNAVATLLKSFLRELPESILTPKIYKTIQNYMSHYHSAAINATTVPKIGMMAGERVGGSNKNQLPSHMDPKSRALAEDIGNLVSELPDCNYYLLHWITRHLSRVDSNHQINKMSTSNLSVIFCPTLGIPSNLFKLMVDFNQIIFPLPKPSPPNTKRNPKIKSPRPFSASSISDHLSAKSSVSSISSGLDHLKLKKLDPMNYFNFKLPSQNSSNVPSARNSQDSQKLKNSDSAERFKSRLRKQNPSSRVISPRLYRDFTIVGDMFNIKNPSMLFQGHSNRDSNSGSMKSEVSVKSRNSILSYQSTSINTYPKLTETLQRSKSNRGSQNGRNSHTSLEEIMKPFQDLGQNKSQITDEPSTISKDSKDIDQLNLDSFQTPSTIYRTPLSTHATVDLPTTPNTQIVSSPKEFDASQLDESTILNLFPRVRSKPNSRANSRKGSISPTSSPTQRKTVTSPSTSNQSPAQQKLGALITPRMVPIPTTPVTEEVKPDDLLNKLRQGLKKTGIKMVPDDQDEQNQS